MSDQKPDPTKPGKTVSYQQPSGEKPPTAVPVSVSYQPGEQTTGSYHGGQSTQGETPPAPRGKTLLPTIPGYEVLGELGRGGMGVVYKARQVALKRLVALKMILSGARASEQDLTRFKAEAQAVAKLQHPNIVQVYEVGEFEGLPYFSLEFVEAGSLADRLKGTPQPPAIAASLVQQLAQAMHAAHERDIVHRDLKPANVLLTGSGEGSSQATTRNAAASATGQSASRSKSDGSSPMGMPKITDFGLAKQLDGEHSGQTVSGAIMGTPSYMAPEQASGRIKEIGPLADVYALGAILYEMLTGRPPFKGATILETLEQVRMSEPVAPTALQPGIPRDLETICLKCLEKDPRRRYDSALSLADDLRRYIEGEPIKARPVGSLERAVKWAKRRPAIAAMLFIIFFLIATGVPALTILYLEAEEEAKLARKAEAGERTQKENVTKEKNETEVQRTKAVENAIEATKQTKIALRSKGQLAFPAAYAALRDGFPGEADKHLDQCPPSERGFEWWHLKRFINSELMPNIFTASEVNRIAFHPDGGQIAFAGGPAVLSLWDLATGRRLPAPDIGKEPIKEFAVHPDGKRVIIARSKQKMGFQFEGTVTVFDFRSGKVLHELIMSRDKLTCFAMSADGRRIAAGDFHQLPGDVSSRRRTEGTVRVWDTDTGKEIMANKLSSGLSSLALTPGGDRVMTGCDDGTVQVWTVPTGKEVGTERHHAKQVTSSAWRPGKDEDQATADETGNVSTVTNRPDIPTHPGVVNKIAYSPNGRFLATACEDRVVRVFDLSTNTEVHRVLSHAAPVVDLAFSPNSQLLATAARDHTVKIWDTHGGQASRMLEILPMPVTAVAISGDSKRAAMGDESGVVTVHDLSTGLLLMGSRVHDGAICGIALNHDGSRMATVNGATFSPMHSRQSRILDPCLKIWDVNTRKMLCKEPTSDLFSGVAYCSDSVLATTGYGADLTFRDAITGKVIRKTEHSGPGGLSVSPDGRYVALNRFQQISVVEVATGKLMFRSMELRTAQNFAWSPDSKRLACALAIKIFSAEERTLNPNDSRNIVRVWEVPSGKVAMTIPHTGFRVLYTPDGLRLIDIGYKAMRFWDASSGQLLLDYPHDNPGVDSAAISNDGQYLIVSTSEHYKDPKQYSTIPGQVRIFDAPRELPVLTLRGHTEAVMALVFNKDGKQLVTSGDDTVRSWTLRPDGERAAGSETAAIRLENVRAGPLVLTPEGDRIIVAENRHDEQDQGGIRVREIATGKQVMELENYDGSFTALALNRAGNLLATAREGQLMERVAVEKVKHPPDLRVWDARTGKLLRTLAGHTMDKNRPVPAADLVFHPDGRRLASSFWTTFNLSSQGEVLVWDATTGQELHRFEKYRSPAFSEDGRLLAAAGDDHIQVWEADSGKPVRKLTPEGKPRIQRLAFRPDGRCLAAIIDATVQVWDVQTGERILCFREMQPWKPDSPFENLVRQADATVPTTLMPNLLTFSPDGARLAIGFYGGFIKVWELPLVKGPGGELVPRSAIGLSFYFNSLALDHFKEGRLLIACGEKAEGETKIVQAIAWWDKLEREHPELQLRVEPRYFATAALARLYRDSGRAEKAASLEQKAEQIKGKTTLQAEDETPEALADRCLERSVQLMRENRYEAMRDASAGARKLYESIKPATPQAQQRVQRQLFTSLLMHARALTELKQWPAALDELKQIEQRFGPQPEPRLMRALTLVRSGEHAPAVIEAEGVARLQIPVTARFTLARIYALAVVAAKEDTKLQAADRERLIERYAALTLQILDQCWKTGGFYQYHDLRERLENDKDLNSVRDRPDFKKFVEDVKKRPRP
jgi:WD40 repeat protein/serine/threonine protein kinase